MRLASALALLSAALPVSGCHNASCTRTHRAPQPLLFKGAAAASTIGAAPALAKGSAGGPTVKLVRRHAISRGQLRPASL